MGTIWRISMEQNSFPDDCPVCPKKTKYSKADFDADFSRYLSIIKESQRVGNAEYNRRLEICAGCRYNSNGLCTQCGCFTEIRCILKAAGCPAPKALW